jgi:hypothetical protein
MTSKLAFVTRLWYYFRVGYSTYLTFLLGLGNTLIVIWYLMIREIPAIESLFGRFLVFALGAVLLGGPLSVAIGWLHIKRTPAYTSEADIGVEANPYNYKLTPGKETEIFAPLYMELLIQIKRLLEAQKLLDDKDRSRIEGLERKLLLLIDGGYVGKPRRKL